MFPIKMRPLLSLCGLLLLSVYVNGQKPLPRYAKSEDFFSVGKTFDVTDIHSDTLGYVYFATGYGFVKFNGKDLNSSWNYENGNSASRYQQIFEGYNNQILLTSSTEVYYVKQDSILAFQIPDTLYNRNTPIESVYLDSEGVLYMASTGNGYFTITPTGELEHVINKTSGISGYGVKKIDNNWFCFSVHQENQTKMSLIHFDEENNKTPIADFSENGKFHLSIVEHEDGTVLFSNGGNEVVQFRDRAFIKKHVFAYDIVSLLIDRDDFLWVGSYTQGFFRMIDRDFSEYDNYIKKSGTAVYAQDNNGGIWFRSDSIGFGYVSPTSVPHYSAQNGFEELSEITKLFYGNDTLIAQNTKGDILLLNSKNEVQNISKNNGLFKISMKSQVQGICYNPINSRLYVVNENNIWIWEDGIWRGVSHGEDLLKNNAFSQLKAIGESRVVGSTRNGLLFELFNDSVAVISETSSETIINFSLNAENEILVARTDGLWKLDNNQFVPAFKGENFTFKNDILFMGYTMGNVWLQPVNEPLYYVKEGKLETILDATGREIHLVATSLSQNGDIWGTLSPEYGTLCRISKRGDAYQVAYFNFDEMATKGYFADAICFSDESIYLGSFFGLYKEKITNLKPISNQITLVPSCYINRSLIPLQSHYELAYNQNDITVTFDAINFQRKPLEYQYLMEGLDEDWQNIAAREIRFINLKPGLYELSLRAKSNNTIWEQPIEISFLIAKPYWQTLWFRITALILILFLIYMIFKLRIRKIRKDEKEKSRIALELNRLEMRALKAQINPHFIFNSITSAILHLSKKEYDKTAFYLEGFAKLLRQILENSDHSVVKLAEEMELMSQYVQIESGHFEGEPIAFDIVYDHINPDEMKIQPTLLQPYIENSIHHGLKSKIGKRIIRVVFQLNKKELEVQIEDNGIGRKAAKANGFYKDYKSYGMFISAKRIELLNKTNFSGVSIDDLENEKGEAMGTRIRFKIPVIQ